MEFPPAPDPKKKGDENYPQIHRGTAALAAMTTWSTAPWLGILGMSTSKRFNTVIQHQHILPLLTVVDMLNIKHKKDYDGYQGLQEIFSHSLSKSISKCCKSLAWLCSDATERIIGLCQNWGFACLSQVPVPTEGNAGCWKRCLVEVVRCSGFLGSSHLIRYNQLPASWDVGPKASGHLRALGVSPFW